MTALNSHAEALAALRPGRITWNVPMARYSTLKVGGPAEAVISVADVASLKRLVTWLRDNEISWRVIGRGSNILVPDHGLPGATIILEGEFNAVDELSGVSQAAEKGKIFIRAGAGCLLPKLVSYCTSSSISGLEFAVGIPGSIGGAVVMNAGAWGREMGSLLYTAALMDDKGRVYEERGENLGFSYRKSSLGRNTIVLSATFCLAPGRKVDIKEACRRYQDLRRRKQPVAEASAGSFFKNPPGDFAGRLIEQAGLKGFAMGGAMISERHANFIVNTGIASATDIFDLMRLVQREVYKRFGVRLEPEVRILGENSR